MATLVSVAPTTDNPALGITGTGDRDRKALRGCIGEWDMLTYDAGDDTLLLDQSSAGNDFTFNSTPTTDSTGVVFDGSTYADMTLGTALADDFSFVLIGLFPPSAAGYYAFGCLNVTEDNGASVRPISNRMDLYLNAGNTVTGPTSTATVWGAGIFTVQDRIGRARSVADGRLGTNHAVQPGPVIDRTLWRLGARMKTTGADETVLDFPLPSGTIAYAMLYDRVVDWSQGACLYQYLKEKMSARGVSI